MVCCTSHNTAVNSIKRQQCYMSVQCLGHYQSQKRCTCIHTHVHVGGPSLAYIHTHTHDYIAPTLYTPYTLLTHCLLTHLPVTTSSQPLRYTHPNLYAIHTPTSTLYTPQPLRYTHPNLYAIHTKHTLSIHTHTCTPRLHRPNPNFWFSAVNTWREGGNRETSDYWRRQAWLPHTHDARLQ